MSDEFIYFAIAVSFFACIVGMIALHRSHNEYEYKIRKQDTKPKLTDEERQAILDKIITFDDKDAPNG